jgi:hypothetical protein
MIVFVSSKSKYPSKKVLVSAALLAALAVTGLLGATPIAAGQVANSTPIQNNTVGISTLQTSSSSSDNASDYFILQSQQELFDATKLDRPNKSLLR